MTKLISVSMLWFVFSCKLDIARQSDTPMQTVEASSCWSKKEAVDQLKDIRQKVEQREDFAALARQYSEDPGSSALGGNLGWIEKDMLVPEYEKAMMALKPEEISGPVTTKFGYHLIQLMEVKGDQYHSRHILLRSCK
jgi:peptidyl-prolyl cis-trans isomerase SurA